MNKIKKNRIFFIHFNIANFYYTIKINFNKAIDKRIDKHLTKCIDFAVEFAEKGVRLFDVR